MSAPAVIQYLESITMPVWLARSRTIASFVCIDLIFT